MKRKLPRILLHSIGITLLSVIFCELIPYDAANMPNFGSSLSMDITDFYNSVAQQQIVSHRDTDIVLVDIGMPSRREMAEALEFIAACEPRVIGLDVVFDAPKENEIDDLYLVETICDIPNLVMATSIYPDSRSFFDAVVPAEKKGFAELGDDQQIIRQFDTHYADDSTELLSLTARMLLMSGINPPVPSHNGDYISYPGIEYDTLHISEIVELHDLLKGKFVLMGTLSPTEDIFYTPTDLRMNGLGIHAHILSTMLSPQRISHMNRVLQWIIALMVVFVLIMVRVYFMFSGNALGDFSLRILQLFVVWLFVYFSYTLFIHHHLYCDLSIALLTCISLLVADAWQAGLYLVKKVLS